MTTLTTQLDTVEASVALMRGQLMELNPPRVTVDLTKVEDKGGFSGPIILAEETLIPKSVVPPTEEEGVVEATVEGLNTLLREWTHKQEWPMSKGSQTPMGQWSPEFS